MAQELGIGVLIKLGMWVIPANGEDLSSGTDKRVAALVYICAFASEDGDTTLVDQDKYPPSSVPSRNSATAKAGVARHAHGAATRRRPRSQTRANIC